MSRQACSGLGGIQSASTRLGAEQGAERGGCVLHAGAAELGERVGDDLDHAVTSRKGPVEVVGCTGR